MKKLIFILIFILCSTLILADYGDIDKDDVEEHRTWADASWDRFIGFDQPISIFNWKTDFYEVQDWEVEYCSKGVTTEFDFTDDVTSEKAFYESFFGTSATLQAFKSNTDETGLYLYEFTWYIKPMESDLNVNISYQIGEDKIQLDFKKVTEGSSWAIYKPFYSSEDITFAYMTYNGNNFKTEVLEKND